MIVSYPKKESTENHTTQQGERVLRTRTLSKNKMMVNDKRSTCWKPSARRLVCSISLLLAHAEAFRPSNTRQQQGCLAGSRSLAPLPRPRTRARGSTFPDSLLLRSAQSMTATGDFAFLGEREFDEDSVLAYLPEQELPPLTESLLKRVTVNYIYGTGESQPVTVQQVLAVIDEEYRSRDVPMQVVDETFDVSRTGEDPDEAVVEVLSFAALHRLPQEITLELFGKSHAEGSSFATCKAAFAQNGWTGVTFPKGLALRTRRKYAAKTERKTFSWVPTKRKLASLAEQAVEGAKRVRSPPQKLKTRQEFLELMEEQMSATAAPAQTKFGRKDDLLFFPNSQPLQGVSFRRMKRVIDKNYAILKAKGRPGVVSYAFLNLVFYSLGVLWQWQKMTQAIPTANSSALLMALKKFGRSYAALYVGSQVFKIPKLFGSVALAPIAERVLNFTKKRLHISENKACVLLVASMLIAWYGMVSLPILAEYTRLKRLIDLERLVHVYEAHPAFVLKTVSMLPTITV